MADDITEILAQLDAKTKEIETLKASIDAKDNEIKTLNETISEKDVNIGKLQKIVSDNLIASREPPVNESINTKSFTDVYKEAIKNNLKTKE